ncbi:MAG: acetyl-CoA carboxylase biotin carboxyl carrier protein [Saprospiraceae bacterium]|nr:acetyl-CoA carboxylase biotin carboxyl carrier protein [Saprospiraceae bacterium]
MNLKEITELVKLVNKSKLIELKIKDGDFEITLRTEKHGLSKSGESARSYVAPPAPAPAPAPPAPAGAPMIQPSETISEPASSGSGEEANANADYLEIRSPMVGTFYRSSAPDKPPYIKVGDTIQQGSVVCIIEAMKLFNEIESEITGRIAKVMVEDATPVEYDQVLFLVER